MKFGYIGSFRECLMLATRLKDNSATAPEIIALVEKASGHRVSTGATYTALNKLVELKLLTTASRSATAQRGGRETTLYSVTEQGELALARNKEIRKALCPEYAD